MNSFKSLRSRGGGLPTTSSKFEDGSGKSIKMEAPLIKAIRNADGFVKGTYIWFFVSIFFIWSGWTWISRNGSSMVLDCNAAGCTLTIQTPYRFIPRNDKNSISNKSKHKRKTIIQIKRDQIVRADNIKYDNENQEIIENYGANSPTYSSQQQGNNNDDVEDFGTSSYEDGEQRPKRPNKPWNQHKRNKHKKRKKYKYKKNNARTGGPDADGNYDSYILVLRDPLPPSFDGLSEEEEDPNESPSKRMQRQMAAQHNTMTHDPNSLISQLAPFIITSDGTDRELSTSTEYVIHPRDFNIGQTRRMARTTVSKINAYVKGRRATCIVREARSVAWQGLVMLILGIFSVVLCLLLGQFWEEYDSTKHGSYKQRMTELRKRQEAQKLRQRRNAGRRSGTVRRGTGTATATTTTRSSAGDRVTNRSVSAGSARSNTSTTSSVTGNARMRPNATANKDQGSEWMGAAHGYTKRGY